MKNLIVSNDNFTGFTILEIEENEEFLYIEWDILETENDLTGEEFDRFILRNRDVSMFEVINLNCEYEAEQLELIEHIGFNDCHILEIFETFEELKEYCFDNYDFTII